MSEEYGRTDMLSCGCTVDADGYIAFECAAHLRFELPGDEGDVLPWNE